ncbi:succinate dehydrogenase iron-sulfur subunit [Thiomicrorhabdus sp. zzn3]|uniref:succinate dehydrogenase iron-sulfur subunit n=1 Tax=Thiomicrorhabdus sp. zzn3 TaxID=3039775 RepID=UPI0024368608|nr:succinate dehydrogenase iron-sulfur subunit [Thiomicrorhabdus sp. zzn3]MDG6777874.1 succinate dehydrogenase iron-sulfur subunit [Thiomicrorhabdus sp. zzn3]
MKLFISRYDPQKDHQPYDQEFELEDGSIASDLMLLDLLHRVRAQDPSLSFRFSCQEGVCGSDAINVNGRNVLSCITPVNTLTSPIRIQPLPGLPIIKDLIVDLSLFYQHYREIHPVLQTQELNLEKEHLQAPEQRSQLDGGYECILCACCSTSCPSFWWNPDQFLGPAALLAAHRFIIDSRDIKPVERLKELDDPLKTFRCRHIQNCTASCPKGLNPSRAIQSLKSMITHHKTDK